MPLDDRGGGHVAWEGLLHRLNWSALRRLGLHLGGAERSRVRGPGLEYSDAREYSPGDDSRLIDWNLTARSDRPYIKDSFPERALDAWLVLDVSPSMSWGTARCLKGQLVTEMAVAACELLGRNGNRLGMFLFGGAGAAIVPARGGRNHRLRLMADLERARRDANNGDGRHGRTDLTGTLERVDRAVRRRALVILVTDFLATSGWDRPLARMSMRHEIVAVQVTDPREGSISDVGLVTLEDPETGEQLTVDTSNRSLRRRFEAAARQQRTEVEERLRRSRVELLTVGTEAELLPRLAQFLARRRALQARLPTSPTGWGRWPAPGVPAKSEISRGGRAGGGAISEAELAPAFPAGA